MTKGARMSHHRGLTLIELLVIVAIVALFVGILLPAFLASRRTASCVQRNTQTRGIHQSMVMYAQGNGGYYPGLDDQGNIVDVTVENRYQILLDNQFFTGEYMISPVESRLEWTTGTVTSQNYSFALLKIDAGGRYDEWKETLNSTAAVISDRNTGSDTQTNVSSIHTDPGDWRGTVTWNDNHTTFETTHKLSDTQYGSGPVNKLDNLFEPAGDDDAYMIYSGD
ncbi:MAG: type II secretion system protein [Phycisphaeraceae bacterium]|nr:type II secretion system protein [Phycisphaeraceae bacterium]